MTPPAADTLSRIIDIERKDEIFLKDQLPKDLLILENIDGGGDSMFEA